MYEKISNILFLIGPIATAISAIAASIAVYVAIQSVNRTDKIIADNADARDVSENISTVMMVLEIEGQMNDRKTLWNQASSDIRKKNSENVTEEVMSIYIDYYGTTKENYFNALDRLCFCISKGYVKEKDWKVEYRNLLQETIEGNESDFGESSRYRNIIDLNRKWQRE